MVGATVAILHPGGKAKRTEETSALISLSCSLPLVFLPCESKQNSYFNKPLFRGSLIYNQTQILAEFL